MSPKSAIVIGQASLEGLRDILLTQKGISDPYLPSSALHGPHCQPPDSYNSIYCAIVTLIVHK